MSASIDISDAYKAVSNAVSLLDNSRQLMYEAAQIGRMSVLNRIVNEKTDPDGNKWQAWSYRRATERGLKGNTRQGLLWDTGSLLQSIGVKDVTKLSASVFTNHVWAYDLQNGRPSTNLPARPFMGWSSESIKNIQHLMDVKFGGI